MTKKQQAFNPLNTAIIKRKRIFHLSRYFSIASLITILIAAVVLGWMYRYIAIEDLKRQGESNNITLLRAFSNITLPQIRSFLDVSNPVVRKGVLRNINQFQINTFHDSVNQLTNNTPVLKIIIYNLNGQVMYSSEQSQIGHVIGKNHPGNTTIKTGKINTHLDFRKRISAINGILTDRWVLSSFMPVKNTETDLVDGTLEIYSDVTDLYEAIISSQNQFALTVIISLGCLYLILFALVRHADNIIRGHSEEREQHLDEIHRINKDLDQYARDLSIARDKALEANTTKSHFLANMSHELRTPLNAIIGYSEMLAEDMEEQKNQGAIEDLSKIKSAGTHLLAIINDILDLSKIEAKSMQLYMEPFEIASVMNDIATTIQPLADKTKNKLTIKCPENIGIMNSDLTRVRQILFNLLGNACKFTSKGKITLSAKREKDGAKEWIIFTIKDTGMGMTSEQIEEKIFQPFKQADVSTTRTHGGTGLGLTISKRFCEMLGGAISVKSQVNKGSTFIVRLPTESKNDIVKAESTDVIDTIDPSKQRFNNAYNQTERRNRISRILVIDDDPAVRDLYLRQLRKDGFEVKLAKDGKEGLRIAKVWRPDVVTLDVMLPEMDGWEVMRKIKETPEISNTPVVMITVLGEKEMGMSLGAADYMTKPINWQKLSDVVKKWVRMR